VEGSRPSRILQNTQSIRRLSVLDMNGSRLGAPPGVGVSFVGLC